MTTWSIRVRRFSDLHADVWLIRKEGAAMSCVLSGLGLSTKTAEEAAKWFRSLGVAVEEEDAKFTAPPMEDAGRTLFERSA